MTKGLGAGQKEEVLGRKQNNPQPAEEEMRMGVNGGDGVQSGPQQTELTHPQCLVLLPK